MMIIKRPVMVKTEWPVAVACSDLLGGVFIQHLSLTGLIDQSQQKYPCGIAMPVAKHQRKAHRRR
jgi:hypothetical protein